MAVNYAETHAKEIDERFAVATITGPAVNKDYNFVGARTVKVHRVPTVAMGDYQSSGTNRYGTPAELEDEVQEMTMVPDRAFTFTVDKGNSQDDEALNEGKALNRQIDEVMVPERDKYILAKQAASAGVMKYGAYTGSGNAGPYERILDMNQAMDEAGVPAAGRLAYVSGEFYKRLKLDPNFVKSGDLAQNMVIKGQLGDVDGLPIMKSYGRLPTGVDCLIVHPQATTAPTKLEDYKVHDNPPGINGKLVEGRHRYDAFVLESKRSAIAVHRATKLALTATNAAGASGKTKFTAVTGYITLDGSAAVPAGTLCYAISASAIAELPIGTDLSDTSAYPLLTLNTDITCAASDKYRVYVKDRNGCLIGESAQGTVARGA